jgi:hypothetical protein
LLASEDGFSRVPPAAEDVWEASLAMEAGRGGNGYGYVPFSWSDVDGFCVLSGFRPAPWKLRALRQMETVWLNHKNKPAGAEPEAPKPGRTFSLALFDAWF